jgi:RNA polymerase sigma-70 factor (ECF subfamily)
MSRQHHPSREARFENLYRSTATDLLAFLTRRASDPEEATDILAEVYLVAWRRLDKVPTDEGARLWLFGVAQKLLLKSNRQLRSYQDIVRGITAEMSAGTSHSKPDDEFTDRVRASLRKLPKAQREALLLTAWEGLKPREIAKVTGSTANLVRVRLHHARKQLQQELSAAPGQDSDDAASDPLRSAPTMT